VVIRTTTIYVMILHETFHVKKWVCESDFDVNVINMVCYSFIDLIPIGNIFYLHWLNFRKEAEKEYMLEKSDRQSKTKGNMSLEGAIAEGSTDFSIKKSHDTGDGNYIDDGASEDGAVLMMPTFTLPAEGDGTDESGPFLVYLDEHMDDRMSRDTLSLNQNHGSAELYQKNMTFHTKKATYFKEAKLSQIVEESEFQRSSEL